MHQHSIGAKLSNKSHRFDRLPLISMALIVAAVCLGTAVDISAPASAQSGYRVCGVYNSAQTEGAIGTGLVAKIWKDDRTDTCAKKIEWMANNYKAAWPGSYAEHHYEMIPCEAFATRSGIAGDPCDLMATNQIYRNYSTFDLVHPQSTGSVIFWHR